jgi:hypothetical protein
MLYSGHDAAGAAGILHAPWSTCWEVSWWHQRADAVPCCNTLLCRIAFMLQLLINLLRGEPGTAKIKSYNSYSVQLMLLVLLSVCISCYDHWSACWEMSSRQQRVEAMLCCRHAAAAAAAAAFV